MADVPAFAEVAADLYVLRYPVLDVNATLIVGAEAAIVVDTLSTDAQGAELLEAVRRITDQPLVIVNTHHHFDHCFGNGALAAGGNGLGIWAHEAAAVLLREELNRLKRQWYDEFSPIKPDLAEAMLAATVALPDRTVHIESIMDIGGRTVELRHLGRGHTDNDLVVLIPDADVALAGDLVEQGGPPWFTDSYPLDWPETVAELTARMTTSTVVVPGHGAPVDRDFVHAQHGELTELAWLIRDGHGDGAPVEAVAAKAPFPTDVALVAVRRGSAELAGRA
jgi:glyoxylase-like metal-dependent hydrolase (beta-lactamase superfamily II)